MSKWEVRMNTEHLYLTAESSNKSLLVDIEQAVRKVLMETYPNEGIEYGDKE